MYSQGGAATNIQSLFMPSLPPTPVTFFTTSAVDSVTNQLSWTNPLDVGFTDTVATPILRGNTSVLYLSTDTGLYRRTVGESRIYLPLLLKAAP